LIKYELINYCESDKYATKAYSLIHNEPESKNLGDITLVDEKEIDDFNMMVGGSPCFTAGTKVITQDGYKNIEDVLVGDYVLTHKNRFKKVLRVGSNKNQLIYSLKAQGILEIKATGNHPFYIKTRSVKYHHNYREYLFSEPYKKELKDIEKGDYVGVPILNTEENKYNLTKEMCWLLGRYVADGYLNNYKRKDRPNSYSREVIITVGKDKIEHFNKKMKNFKYNIYKKTNSCWQCVFRDKELWNFINDNNFGKYANEKNIPQFIIDLPIDLLEEFINGYMSGDGCKIKDYYQATTISQELAMNLCLCIQKVYRTGCRIYYLKRPKKHIIEGREINQQDTYLIRYKTEETKQKQYYVENDIIWYPVTKVVSLNYYEDVFNIEVETDHTYTANNTITFNCQDFSVAGKGRGAVWTCMDCKDDEGNNYQYNPLEVHYTKRDKCPKCNSINIEKTRSSLVVEWLRILNEKKPNIAIYENVKNLVGKKHRYFFDLFIQELHEYGYNTYWKVLNAKNYGIPQNRERVYLIIIKKELDNGKFKFPEGFDNGIRLKDILEKEVDEKYYISQDKVDKLIKQLKDKEYSNTVKTSGHGSTDRHMWDLVAVKNNDSVVLKVGNINPSGNGMNGCVYSEEGIASTVTTNKGEGNKVFKLEKNKVKQIGNIVDTGNWKNPQRGRIYSKEGICPALNTVGGGGLEPKILEDFYSNREVREYEEYSPTLRADRQGLKVLEETNKVDEESPAPELVGGIGEINFGKQYRQGNRVYNADKTAMCLLSQPVGNTGGNSYLYLIKNDEEAIQNISDDYKFAKSKCQEYYDKNGYLPEMFNPYNQKEITDVAPTQTVSCNRSCSSATVLIKDIWYRIRKLIPLECFRLMGFEDEDFYILKENGISDTQCYKMAGNSIVVDVLYYIYLELYKAMPYLFDDIKLGSFFSGIGAFEKAILRLQKVVNKECSNIDAINY
jgi:DNA (cytosine-5)-methyltransferase 1